MDAAKAMWMFFDADVAISVILKIRSRISVNVPSSLTYAQKTQFICNNEGQVKVTIILRLSLIVKLMVPLAKIIAFGQYIVDPALVMNCTSRYMQIQVWTLTPLNLMYQSWLVALYT